MLEDAERLTCVLFSSYEEEGLESTDPPVLLLSSLSSFLLPLSLLFLHAILFVPLQITPPTLLGLSVVVPVCQVLLCSGGGPTSASGGVYRARMKSWVPAEEGGGQGEGERVGCEGVWRGEQEGGWLIGLRRYRKSSRHECTTRSTVQQWASSKHTKQMSCKPVQKLCSRKSE
eukprot:GHVS01104391.1.p2 GENE.GHVS01104391.1~~GHVS01104391.1.p2  ORF type:complete len:173 (-),score=38.16 GHVS01104391.1:317-835(-)